MKLSGHIAQASRQWSQLVYRHAGICLLGLIAVTTLAVISLRTISVSTQISALMPQNAPTVQALEKALEKTGSFAAVQIVVEGSTRDDVLDTLEAIQNEIQTLNWVGSSQYYEDVELLANRQLLLLSRDELLQLETDLSNAFPTLVAQYLSEAFGTDASFTLRNRGVVGQSTVNDLEGNQPELLSRLQQFESLLTQETRRYFLSPDGLTGVVIAWPKAGRDSLLDAKGMIDDSYAIIDRLSQELPPEIFLGVAGRIASQVAQFDAIMRDLRMGLISAIILIILLILISYRRVSAIPIILIPLTIGIVWTMGFAALTVGSLNLITVFLTLILFGLGIDFAIHNLSRYREERHAGNTVEDALDTMIVSTGGASLIAALTTGLGFFTLTLTEFRAFSEFGLIAGSGIWLIFLAIYSAQPALIVICERLGLTMVPERISVTRDRKSSQLSPLSFRWAILLGVLGLLIGAAHYAPQMRFEVDTKRLEAKMPERHIAASERIAKVITIGNSRAIIVADNYSELVAINDYLNGEVSRLENDSAIKSVSSILDYVPDQIEQQERIKVIRRLNLLASELQNFDPNRYEAKRRLLTVEAINLADLPNSLRRTYLGQSRPDGVESDNPAIEETSYLIYVDPAVNMDNADQAARFYDTVGQFEVSGKTTYAASESFVLVEMLQLMKADALKAILLVSLTTTLVIFLFVRSFLSTVIILAPTGLGVFVTLGIMGAFGPALSIMNMVVLPSLIGISVDNGVHIFHRFHSALPSADIPAIMSSTGRAAILTTLTTLIGFGGMITASMMGLRSLALLAIIGFLTCLFMTWYVLPLLLELSRRTLSPSFGPEQGSTS